MLYSAIKGMCFISANGSIESPHHLRLSIIFTTKMADQDVKESHEKTVNLETLWRWNKNNLFCPNGHTCEW